MEQSHMRVDACRPMTIKAKTLLLLELLLQKRLLHHINIYCLNCLSCLNCYNVNICCKNLRYRSTTQSQPGPSPSTPPSRNPLLLRALIAVTARRFPLPRLPTALLPCRVRQPRHTAINGTVQNNAGGNRVDGLGDLSRHGKQFRGVVANAIGRSEGNWRPNLANRRNTNSNADSNANSSDGTATAVSRVRRNR